MTTKRPLPFDLAPSRTKQIEINPEIYGVMIEESELTKKAINLIESHWCETADRLDLPENDAFFGLFLPIRYGITAPEERSLDRTVEMQKQTSADMMDLSAKIASELGMGIPEVKRLILNSQETLAPELFPYSGDILEITAKNAEIEYDTKISTILIKRAIPEWTDELSAVLHPSITTEILKFEQEERNSGKAGMPPKQTNQLTA